MLHMCLAKQPCSIRWGPGPAHQGLPGLGMAASLEEGKAQALSEGVPPQVFGQNEGDRLPPRSNSLTRKGFAGVVRCSPWAGRGVGGLCH